MSHLRELGLGGGNGGVKGSIFLRRREIRGKEGGEKMFGEIFFVKLMQVKHVKNLLFQVLLR